LSRHYWASLSNSFRL